MTWYNFYYNQLRNKYSFCFNTVVVIHAIVSTANRQKIFFCYLNIFQLFNEIFSRNFPKEFLLPKF